MIVLVELGATERSPGRSPTKIYTPLKVISPVTQANNPGPSTSVLPRSTAEKTFVPKDPPAEEGVPDSVVRDDDSSVVVLHQTCEGMEHHVEQPLGAEQSENTQTQGCDTPPLPAMDLFPGEISQELLEGIVAAGSSHMMSSPFSRYILDRSHEEETTSPTHHTVELEPIAQANLTNTPTQNLVIDEEEMMPRVNPGRISITRNEILALPRALDRLPPSLLQGEDSEWDQPISLMVTNEPVGN